MSQITEIITAIGNVNVDTKTLTPVVFSLENAKDSVRATPARFVFPIQDDNEGRNTTFLTLGTMQSVEWMLADIMLFSPAKKGATLQAALPELVAYVGNYIEAFKTRRKLGLQHVTVENIDHEWGRYAYPLGTDNDYYGVLMRLTIREIIP